MSAPVFFFLHGVENTYRGFEALLLSQKTLLDLFDSERFHTAQESLKTI
jgi:hypothetical protein